jgi:hypothetical protein
MRTPTVLTKHGFNIGDRVRFVDDIDPERGVVFGQEGIICTFEGCLDKDVGVRWDKESGKYHHCSSFCEHRYGWYVPYYSLVNISESVDLGEINVDTDVINSLF